MATRLEILEDKSKSIEEKAIVLLDISCKTLRKKVENGRCPYSCDKCLDHIKTSLAEEVGELS